MIPTITNFKHSNIRVNVINHENKNFDDEIIANLMETDIDDEINRDIRNLIMESSEDDIDVMDDEEFKRLLKLNIDGDEEDDDKDDDKNDDDEDDEEDKITTK